MPHPNVIDQVDTCRNKIAFLSNVFCYIRVDQFSFSAESLTGFCVILEELDGSLEEICNRMSANIKGEI